MNVIEARAMVDMQLKFREAKELLTENTLLRSERATIRAIVRCIAEDPTRNDLAELSSEALRLLE